MKKLSLLLFLVLISLGCSQKSQQTKDEGDRAIRVTTAKSTETTYHPYKTFNGTAFAFREANLGTTLPGKVEKTHFEKGAWVSKGTLLVELSSELYAQALAKKNTLEKDFQRVSRLREKGSVTQQKYDHIKAEYKAAEAEVRMMRENCRVRAPFSGVIVDYLVKEGENFMFSPGLKPGYSHTSGIVQLMELNRLKIKMDVNEQELPDIEVEQPARVTFGAMPDTTLTGKVSHIAPILSTTTHTATVEVTIPNKNREFKPGMYATADIKMPERKDIFIPLNAIFRQKGTDNKYVFIVNEQNVVRRKAISTLYTKKEKVAVAGLGKNQEVVVHGKNKLKDRDKVIVDNAK